MVKVSGRMLQEIGYVILTSIGYPKFSFEIMFLSLVQFTLKANMRE
jgi:hypothetical protein